MSLSSPKPPDVPAASDVANTQQDFNLKSAASSQAASNVNQVNPYGSLTYSQSGTGPGGIPLYTSKVELSPQQQSLLNTLQGNQQTAGTQAGQLLNKGNYGAQNPADVIGGMTSGTTKDLLGKYTDYLNPFFKTSTDQLDTKLRNQGLKPGDPGYDIAMRGLNTDQGQTVSGALAQFEPQAYQQATSSYLLPLQTSLQELGISQPGSVNQNLVNTPQANVQPANYIGAQANAQQALQQQYQSKLSQQQAMMSGLFGIPTAILGGMARGGTLGTLGGLISAGA